MTGSIKASVQEFILLKNPAGGCLDAEKSAFWASSDPLRCSVAIQKVSLPSEGEIAWQYF